MSNRNCAGYSADTEVLARRGWLTFDQVLYLDEIATRSPDGRFEWQHPTALPRFSYAGEMIQFGGRSLDLLVMPGHRMAWSRMCGQRAKARIESAAEIEGFSDACLVGTSTYDAPDLECKVFRVATRATRGPAPREVTMTGDQYAGFMGMWLSEGCAVPAHGDWRVYVSQTDAGKGYAEYQELLTAICGREPMRNSGSWIIHSRALFDYLIPLGKAVDKRIPRDLLDLSRRQLEIFWRFYFLGDGATAGAGMQVVATASIKMAGQLQEVIQKLGLSASVREEKCRGNAKVPGERLIYKLGVRKTLYPEYKASRVPYAGLVSGATVPNGLIYVRRNGRPAWSAG